MALSSRLSWEEVQIFWDVLQNLWAVSSVAKTMRENVVPHLVWGVPEDLWSFPGTLRHLELGAVVAFLRLLRLELPRQVREAGPEGSHQLFLLVLEHEGR